MKQLNCSAMLLTVLLAIFGGTNLAFAQGTDLGTIAGLVTDGTGAVVPNARVVILDLATNTQRETNTNAQGEYRVFGLRAGRYQVSVSAQGMRTIQITGIEVKGSDTIAANAVLTVASATESVEVTAEAPLLNTENQTITDTISSREVI